MPLIRSRCLKPVSYIPAAALGRGARPAKRARPGDMKRRAGEERGVLPGVRERQATPPSDANRPSLPSAAGLRRPGPWPSWRLRPRRAPRRRRGAVADGSAGSREASGLGVLLRPLDSGPGQGLGPLARDVAPTVSRDDAVEPRVCPGGSTPPSSWFDSAFGLAHHDPERAKRVEGSSRLGPGARARATRLARIDETGSKGILRWHEAENYARI